MTEPGSPCTGVCETRDGVCVGCGRTLAEIADWAEMSPEERRDVLQRLGRDPDE